MLCRFALRHFLPRHPRARRPRFRRLDRISLVRIATSPLVSHSHRSQSHRPHHANCLTHEHPSASCSTFHSLPVGPKQAKFLTRQDLRLPNRRPIALPLQNYALHASKAAEDEPVFTITSVFFPQLLPSHPIPSFPPNPFFLQSLEGLRAQLEELTYKQKRLERNIHTMQLQRTARLQSQQPAPLLRAVETQESSVTGSAPPQTAVGLVKAGGARSNAAGQRFKAADDEKGKAPRFLNLENVSE
jgi:hypothetical protein